MLRASDDPQDYLPAADTGKRLPAMRESRSVLTQPGSRNGRTHRFGGHFCAKNVHYIRPPHSRPASIHSCIHEFVFHIGSFCLTLGPKSVGRIWLAAIPGAPGDLPRIQPARRSTSNIAQNPERPDDFRRICSSMRRVVARQSGVQHGSCVNICRHPSASHSFQFLPVDNILVCAGAIEQVPALGWAGCPLADLA